MLTVEEFKRGMADVFATVADKEEQKKRVHALLSELEFSEEELAKHAKFVDDRYTRNIIHVDDDYVALLMCWQNSGVRNPIHNHPGSFGFVKGISGTVLEHRFQWDLEKEELTSKEAFQVTELKPGLIAYIDDEIGLHSMQGREPGSMSLHIYVPTHGHATTFNPKTFEKGHVEYQYDTPEGTFHVKSYKP
eukprot:TRINITY_DN82280_c0_g1_i1.p1 TRINITY_DN82280_c0_g1~~TRINITY_DN82280_c0_g1_i1.p1  ORF type:complete len:191 (-),score=55.24 TRINITY_DN82280_c0_g1_i1:147-719(-)